MWLPEWNEPAVGEAWREIVRRSVHCYGPSSREDFARGWGMQPAPAERILKASADELMEVDVQGYRGFALTADVEGMRTAKSRETPVRLLPTFDVYVTGTRPRTSFVDERFENRVFRTGAWISSVVLVDGKVSGVWSSEGKNRRLDVKVEPFRKLTAAVKQGIGEEVERLGSFLDTPTELSFSRVAS